MSARTIPYGWGIGEPMGYDETLEDVFQRMCRINRILSHQPVQHDSHIQRYRDHKAGEVLEWLLIQRYDQDHQ